MTVREMIGRLRLAPQDAVVCRRTPLSGAIGYDADDIGIRGELASIVPSEFDVPDNNMKIHVVFISFPY